jgi:hypothetical protein
LQGIRVGFRLSGTFAVHGGFTVDTDDDRRPVFTHDDNVHVRRHNVLSRSKDFWRRVDDDISDRGRCRTCRVAAAASNREDTEK